MQNSNTPFCYTFPINRRIRKRALSHNSLPYTSTKAALEENMISALLESMTKQAVGASSITPAAHYLLGYNGVTKDQPEEERVPRGKTIQFSTILQHAFSPSISPKLLHMSKSQNWNSIQVDQNHLKQFLEFCFGSPLYY